MLVAVTIPAELWNTLFGALFGGLLSSGIVAYVTQRLTERRERRNLRDELRLDLYLEVIDLVLDNELVIAERGSEGSIPSVELQTKRLKVSHRLKLLGSRKVQDAYDAYRKLVFQETAHPVPDRPRNPNDVVARRETLIELMKNDIEAT